MTTDNNIKNYSAGDIEKYHKGLLSAKERHDLEKAALDDPFLADALEGYAVAGLNVSADIDDLKKRLEEKVTRGKLMTMKSAGKNSFPWLRVAALVIIVAGAGLMARQFIFTGKSKDIAQAEPKKANEVKNTNKESIGTIVPNADSLNNKPGSISISQNPNKDNFSFSDSLKVAGNSDLTLESGKAGTQDHMVTVTSNGNQPGNPAPVNSEGEKINVITKPVVIAADEKAIASENGRFKTDAANNKDFIKLEDKAKESKAFEERQLNRSVAAAKKISDDKNFGNQVSSNFRGQVTDANNVGLPFANVTNPQDNNAGTYTDARGYFNLTYPDSVLTVQIRSVGFENTNVQLRNTVSTNQVILQNDSKSLSEVVINKKPNTAVRREDNNVKLEEPEPADGWDNYDTYIANNLNPPEEIKTKQNAGGEVELSFEVDKDGNPVNIKVVKSLCSKCDEEAKRLIKEGPKWKRNAKKGKTTVKIPFNISH